LIREEKEGGGRRERRGRGNRGRSREEGGIGEKM